ncbi:putative proton-dependent oligopeptide transporter family, major facilitator superfamily [Lupinus albus]|uniref:Putative proton-dependent oligopeptide transporter family, major facilitator superfamily n=1 Tax=Lupinus albus TaxID=3870 RepID=A0A6A4NNI4_LUPAL|nr:putative proton-dependent oligopeptide transporter family, major facilitator superfamily [Lupinus albus]
MTPELRPSCETINGLRNSASAAQLAVLFISLGLISIGAGCVRPCSIAFGADQLSTKENSSDERLLDSYFNWYYSSIGASTLVAFGVIVYIQENLGWKIGFAVPAILMLISAFSFIIGSPYYVKVKASNSLFTSFVQVVVVATKNRKINLSECIPDQYYHGRDPNVLVPTDSLRFLNKACVTRNRVRDLKPDGSISDPWSLCTVEKHLHGVPRLILNASSKYHGLAGRVFGNFKIPAGSFNIIMIITLSIVIPVYDRVIVPWVTRYTSHPRGFSSKFRMGIRLLFIIASRATSTIVETARRSAAIEEGFEDQPNAEINMTALWLVPQFVILGFAEAFYPIGQVEFFYSYFPKSMSSFAMAIVTLGLAAADVVGSVVLNTVDKVTSIGGNESWLSTNINKGHLNYYYALTTLIGSINFLYFLAICWAYGPNRVEKVDASTGKEDEQFHYMELPSS